MVKTSGVGVGSAMYRLKVTFGHKGDRIGYIVKEKSGDIKFISSEEAKLSLGGITLDPALLRFTLEDNDNGSDAVKMVRGQVMKGIEVELL